MARWRARTSRIATPGGWPELVVLLVERRRERIDRQAPAEKEDNPQRRIL